MLKLFIHKGLVYTAIILIFILLPSVLSGQSPGRDLVINEISATNHKNYSGARGEVDDWIELYNRSENPLSLEGYYLSDNFSKPLKWALPSVILDAGAYLVVLADDKPGRGKLHANFKISAEGEEIILSHVNGNSADMISFGAQAPGQSLGRWPDATGVFVEMDPTFKSPNFGDPTSTNMAETKSLLQVFPSPSSRIIHIVSPDPEPGRMYIYSSLGQLFYRGNHKESMDISFLGAGHYIIKSGSHIAVFQVEK